MTWRVPLADIDYGDAESQAVLDVLANRWLTMGEVTMDFESQFARAVGAEYALATSNATAALHLACLALGIGAGDEVIVPSLSFVATASAVLYTGAKVRFADILGLDELNISPGDIVKQITPHTKAIIVMHYSGYPCRMPEILDIAGRHKLSVIEDAAHAPGASLAGKALGTWGDVGCFSFFSNKNIATGEGGMLVTDREDIADRVKLLRSHAMTSLTWDRHQGHAYTYDVVDLGYNDRIDEIRSSLGLVQLKKLNANNTQRKRIAERYFQAFSGTGLGLPFQKTHANMGAKLQTVKEINPSHHIFPVILPERVDRADFMEHLHAAGVQTSIHYPPIHKFSYYRRMNPSTVLPETEEAARREVTLPLFPTMSDEQVSLVVESVITAL